jgi:hypothetical protein
LKAVPLTVDSEIFERIYWFHYGKRGVSRLETSGLVTGKIEINKIYIMDHKGLLHWRIIIDGDNVPKTCDPVVGYWLNGCESYTAICFYDPDDRVWYDTDQTKKGDYTLTEPDYWIELPDIDYEKRLDWK